MKKLLKILTETGNMKLLNILIKCINDDCENGFSDGFKNLQGDELVFIFDLLVQSGYSKDAAEKIMKEI